MNNVDLRGLVQFKRPERDPNSRGPKPETFDFLGFTHYWGKSQKGNQVFKSKTSSKRLRRTLKQLKEWGWKEPNLVTERPTGTNQSEAVRALQLLRYLKQLGESGAGLLSGETPLEEMAGTSESRWPDELGEVQSVTGELSTDTTAYSP